MSAALSYRYMQFHTRPTLCYRDPGNIRCTFFSHDRSSKPFQIRVLHLKYVSHSTPQYVSFKNSWPSTTACKAAAIQQSADPLLQADKCGLQSPCRLALQQNILKCCYQQLLHREGTSMIIPASTTGPEIASGTLSNLHAP